MSEALAINNNALDVSVTMPKTKAKKKKVLNEIKSKVEQAKLNLIYTELEEANISCRKDFTTVKELTKSLKGSLSTLDYNKSIAIIDKVSKSLDEMVDSLEAGSTNAFTKLMTSDLAKTIGKSLGISLAGRTALILAPTIGTKALVGAGLGIYGLYKIIKNRKEIVKSNQINELNSILMELETTKNGDDIVDTRFNEEIQEEIKKFLKNANVTYEDTGYRSLREAIYSLDLEQKRSLCELLNSKLGKGIEINERIKKAKKKLNVVANGAANVSVGAGIGANVASAINSVDPGITAGLLNGTFLGAWIEKQTQTEWFAALSGGLGLIGTEVIEHLPVVGGVAQKIFAMENLAAFTAIGATGGLIATGALTVASIVKNIVEHVKSNKSAKEFLELDSKKYEKQDEKEMELIRQHLHEPKNEIELVIIDIVNGYLKDENIQLHGNPKSIMELNELINQLDGDSKKKARDIVVRITNEVNNDPSFVNQLKKAGKISIGLFTAGFAVMSVYDIIKGGTFLPELSRKLFPVNNIHNPIQVPDPLDKPLDPNISKESNMINNNQQTYDGFKSDQYLTEKDGDYMIDYGANYTLDNDGIAGMGAGNELMNYGMDMNLFEKFLSLFGWEPEHEMVPNIPKIAEELNKLSPQKLYEFYRYYNGLENDGSELYKAVGETAELDKNKLMLGIASLYVLVEAGMDLYAKIVK